jgi:hypothetical protein
VGSGRASVATERGWPTTVLAGRGGSPTARTSRPAGTAACAVLADARPL